MTILHLDDDLLAVCKPSGLLAQPDHTGAPDVLSQARARLAEHTGEPDPFVGLVHRLDRPTSGIMVLARTSAAARALSAQFRERTVSKEYFALVEGTLRGIGTWTDYIVKRERQPTIVSPDDPDGKRAHLDWQALARADNRTLVRLQLTTGRPHQIRLQSAERGHPVVGDRRYGASAGGHGIFLHHAIMRLDPPSAAPRLTLTAEPPSRWASTLHENMRAAVDRALRQARPS
ncbi:MAG: RluA family pseudouridine synthase [Salinivenus sp.]